MVHKVPKAQIAQIKKNAEGKAPRADFALPGGRFPLNTPGRRKVAVKDAVISERAGNISAGEVATIRRKVKST